jgi:starch phosphorylase
MKAALNGALTIGTLDGANVEIREQVGAENFFLFGHSAEEIVQLGASGYRPGEWINKDAALQRAIGTIESLEGGIFQPLAQELRERDRYFHCADYAAYCAAQAAVATAYTDQDAWARTSILNVAGMGIFSIDRTVREYAGEIWKTKAVPVPMP